MAHIGVDLHINSFSACRLIQDGSETISIFQLAQADLDRFRAGLSADDEIAVEATGNSTWFRDQVIGSVKRLCQAIPGDPQVGDKDRQG